MAVGATIVGPIPYPEGPSTQYLRLLVPKTIPLVGTKDLKYWVLGPSGIT